MDNAGSGSVAKARRLPSALASSALLTIIVAGCTADARDAPSTVHIVKTAEFIGMEEAFTGKLRLSDTGCIAIEREGVEYLLVWPNRAQAVEQSGVIGVEIDGEFLAVGTDVNVTGGGGIDGELDTFAPEMPPDCAGSDTFYLVNTTTPLW